MNQSLIHESVTQHKNKHDFSTVDELASAAQMQAAAQSLHVVWIQQAPILPHIHLIYMKDTLIMVIIWQYKETIHQVCKIWRKRYVEEKKNSTETTLAMLVVFSKASETA